MKALKFSLKNQTNKLKNLATRVFQSDSLVLSQSTPYQIIHHYQNAKIRYYPAAQRQHLEPLIFIPPLAVTVSIYDLYPYRSLVNYFQQQGFEVYLLDWGRLDYRHHQLSFTDFLDDMIPYCVDFIRQHADSEQVSLHGWSMGGLFASLFTASQQHSCVKNLISLGAPVDSFVAGWHGQLLKSAHQLLQRHPKLAQPLYSGKLPKKIIHTPGKLNAMVFKLIDPVGWWKSHKRFLTHLDDHQAIQEHATMGAYLNNMIDYPGGINQDMMLNIWLQNPLKNGYIQFDDRRIDLKNIQCNLLVGAGFSDRLVSAAAVQPLAELTNSPDVTFTMIPGGHMGIMSNQNTAKEFWPVLADWLKQRSTPL